MMYFIPWVILLACIILAVPIASWLDGRKVRAEFGDLEAPVGDDEMGEFDDAEAEAAEGEPAAMEAGGEEEFGGDGGFGGDAGFGGEDFSEFEEIK